MIVASQDKTRRTVHIAEYLLLTSGVLIDVANLYYLSKYLNTNKILGITSKYCLLTNLYKSVILILWK